MRHYFVISLFLITLLPISAQEIVVTGEECEGYQAPRVLLSGDRLLNKCDTLFIVNTTRYRLYKEAVEMILELDTASLFSGLSGLEASLGRLDIHAQSMQEDYDALEKSYHETIDKQEKELSGTRNQLAVTIEDLRQERKRIEEIQSNLKQSKHSSARNRFFWGVGGMAVGVIGALLVLN